MNEPAKPFISYAQHGEDVILWRALGDRIGVCYVDIGAFDPTIDSVTRALYERGWRGLNVEPQPDRLAAFQAERPLDTNLSLAIGDHDGTATLTVPQTAGWSTTVPSALVEAELATSRSVDVPMRRLDTLFAECEITHVDVLKVDVEGAEPAVVRGLLEGPVRPLVCVVEGVTPGIGRSAGDEAVRLLVEAGYVHCLFDGLNHYLTVVPALVEALSVPANPTDGYIPATFVRLEEERRELHATIAALAAENLGLRTAARDASKPAPAAAQLPGGATAERPDAPAAGAPETLGITAAGATQAGGHPSADSPTMPSAAHPGGDLPLPGPDSSPVGPVVDLGSAPTSDRLPHIDPALRVQRRRTTFVQLLGTESGPLRRGANALSPDRLLTLAIVPLEPSDAVRTLYRAILDREVDPNGMSTWTTQLNLGLPLIDLAKRLASSVEALASPPALRAQVTADLITWESLLAVEELGAGGLHSRESWTPGRIADLIYVLSLYEVALHRRPGPGELQLELDKLASGVGREWLLRAFAQKPSVLDSSIGVLGTGLRSRLRRWRDSRGHLDRFRDLVHAAESRRIAQLMSNLDSVEPSLRYAPGDLPQGEDR